MRVVLFAAAGLLASASVVSDAPESGSALSLLQTSSAKLQVVFESDKECKAATRAVRDAKKELKSGKAAAKAARAALKAAKETASEQQKVLADAQAALATACPAAEVNGTLPDEGCSKTVITSSNGAPVELLNKLPYAGWFGFDQVVPGGGVLDGKGTTVGKLGPGVLQPCSMGWTVGKYMLQQFPGVSHVTHEVNSAQARGIKAWKEKKNLENPCACREWAASVMPFPEGAVVQYHSTNKQGSGLYGSLCKVFRNGGVSAEGKPLLWEKGGFSPALDYSGNVDFSCYMGNPDEWKLRVDTMKANNQLVDKCSKTSAWVSAKVQHGPYSVNKRNERVGLIAHPNPDAKTEGGRKLCLRWVRNDPKCADAVGIQLTPGTGGVDCICIFQTPGVGREARRYTDPIYMSHQYCIL